MLKKELSSCLFVFLTCQTMEHTLEKKFTESFCQQEKSGVVNCSKLRIVCWFNGTCGWLVRKQFSVRFLRAGHAWGTHSLCS